MDTNHSCYCYYSRGLNFQDKQEEQLLLISASAITTWAVSNKRQAQDTITELVRLLILESDPDAQKVDIPSGDSVALPGLDGVVLAPNGFYPEQLLPVGETVWEFGTDQNVTTKVNKDYAKRTSDRKLKAKKTKTYVAVSPQVWTTKETWVKNKQKDKKWKSVHALNAEDLAQWLDRCPQTRDWFASSILGVSISELGAEVLPILLLTGEWDTLYEADKALVETIANVHHETIEKNLQRLSKDRNAIGASLFHKKHSRWKLLAPDYAWEIAEFCITEDAFNRFFQQVKAIFSVIPADYVSPAERGTYSVHNIGTGNSENLKNGMAQALARIATSTRTDAPGYSGRSPQGLVDVCLGKVFSKERRYEPAFWLTISPYLSLLAEAWDSGLLDCLEDVLYTKSEALSHLFQTGQYVSSPAVSGLFFALEKLAWHPPHLSRVADILLALSRFDASLRHNEWGAMRVFEELFAGWYANTAASLQEQREILTRIVKSSPQEGWQLLMAAMPNSNTLIVSRAEPQFRKPAIPVNRHCNPEEFLTHIEALWDLALENAGTAPKRWSDLLGQVDEFKDTPLFDKFISALGSEITQIEGDTTQLWEQGILLLAKHRKFPDTNWAFSHLQVEQLEGLIKQLMPSDSRKRYRFLFTQHSMDLCDVPLDDEHFNYAEMDQSVLERRKEAVLQLLTELSDEELALYALDLAEVDGTALYHLASGISAILNLDDTRHSQFLIGLFNHLEDRLKWLSATILSTVIRLHGPNQVMKWAMLQVDAIPKVSIAILWGIFSPDKKLWEQVHSFGQEVETQYWQKIRLTPQDCEAGGEPLVAKLLENEQGGKALNCLGWQIRAEQQPSPAIVMDSLALFLRIPSDQNGLDLQLRPYNIEKLFEYLETVAELAGFEQERLVQLEWAFFPLLKQRTTKFQLSLFEQLASSPALFVDMLKVMFYSDLEVEGSTERPTPTEEQRTLAKQAFHVLHKWNLLPGEHNKDIDAIALMLWYEKGLELAKEADREDIFNSKFGEKLGECPLNGQDGYWPHEAIRKLIELPGNDLLRQRFSSGKVATIHGKVREVQSAKVLDEESARELQAASAKIFPLYPKTAAVLVQIASRLKEHWFSGYAWD